MTMKYVAASALLVGVMAGFNAKATDLLQAWQAAEQHERELAVARAAHAAADPLRRQADAFIDHALMNGLTNVYIIHGRGTGALRTAITQHLKRHKSVKSFRLGRYGEGEDGVTVVELK